MSTSAPPEIYKSKPLTVLFHPHPTNAPSKDKKNDEKQLSKRQFELQVVNKRLKSLALTIKLPPSPSLQTAKTTQDSSGSPTAPAARYTLTPPTWQSLISYQGKFTDPDFGPTPDDPSGLLSMYRLTGGKPPNVGYPGEGKVGWVRPVWSDGSDDEDEDDGANKQEESDDEFASDNEDANSGPSTWTTNAKVFTNGTSSNDIVQGSLGDCWFLGALSVLANKPKLLKKCFYDPSWNTSTADDDSDSDSDSDSDDESLNTPLTHTYQNLGLFTLCIRKPTGTFYVIIDTLIPNFLSQKSIPLGPCFAKCRDKTEMWLPLIEKAYAKLHGGYTDLVGGYTHYGLRDLTGFAPWEIVFKSGVVGFGESVSKDDLWNTIYETLQGGGLGGCSMQPRVENGKSAGSGKVEAEGRLGLRFMHAYGLLGVGIIKDERSGEMVKLVKVRNPWGFGEWCGKWSDGTEEREANDASIRIAFGGEPLKVSTDDDDDNVDIDEEEGEDDTNEINGSDGTFFMHFSDFYDNFTNVFLAVKFPRKKKILPSSDTNTSTGTNTSTSTSLSALPTLLTPSFAPSFFHLLSTFDPALSGNRGQSSWSSNPLYTLTLLHPNTKLFISIEISDARLTYGASYYKEDLQSIPLTFDLITPNQLLKSKKDRGIFIPNSLDPDGTETEQPAYAYQSLQVKTQLTETGSYYLIPSLWKRRVGGEVNIFIWGDKPITFVKGGGGVARKKVESESEGEEKKLEEEESFEDPLTKQLDLPGLPKGLTLRQFNIHIEDVREKLVSKAEDLNISVTDIYEAFLSSSGGSPRRKKTAQQQGKEETTEPVVITRKVFKQKLMSLGFNLIDFPDEDFLALDVDNSGVITLSELNNFLNIGVENSGLPKNLVSKGSEGEEPVDDMKFQPGDLDGVVWVEVLEARNLKMGKAWFDSQDGRGDNARAKTLVYGPIPDMYGGLRPGTKSKEDLIRERQDSELSSDYEADVVVSNEVTASRARTSSALGFASEVTASRAKTSSALGFASLASTLSQPQPQSRSIISSMLATSTASNWMSNAKTSAVDASKIHYSEPIKKLEGLRNAFLRRVKSAPYKCSSDTQPVCWDRLPKGVKIEESYFSERPEPRKNIKEIKRRRMLEVEAKLEASSGTGTENFYGAALHLKNSVTEQTLMRDWITNELATEVLDTVLTNAHRIREFRLAVATNNSDGEKKKINAESERIRIDIRDSTLVYQRLSPLKMLDLDSLIGQRGASTDALLIAQSFFRYLDRDNSGAISPQEFFECLSEMRLMISSSDAALLLQRFKTDDESKPNMIRYREFLAWAEGAQNGKMTREESMGSISSLSSIIAQIFGVLVKNNVKLATLKFDKASLELSQGILRDLGCRVSINSIFRLVRCFDEDPGAFNKYLDPAFKDDGSKGKTQAPPTATTPTSKQASKSISSGMERLLKQKFAANEERPLDFSKLKSALQAILLRKCTEGGSSGSSSTINTSKIWAQLAKNKTSTVPFNDVRDKFQSLLAEEESTFDDGEGWESACVKNFGLSLKCATSIILDDAITFSKKKETVNVFDFSDVDSFIKEVEINNLESKFYLALQVHSNKTTGSIVLHQMSVYVNRAKDALLVKAVDCMTMKTFYMKQSEDLSDLKLPANGEVYNSLFYPNEEGGLWRFVHRLNLLSVNNKTTLTASEQVKFVQHLRTMFLESPLPYFVTVNTLCICFLVDTATVKSFGGSIEKAIFLNLKKQTKLFNFLRSTYSCLKVTFSTYDGHASSVHEWGDFLAHLNGYRNPYATIELLPQDVPCVNGGVMDEHVARSPDTSLTNNFRATSPAMYGGSHPRFSAGGGGTGGGGFQFLFSPPKISSLPILFTSVCKLKISAGLVVPLTKLFVIMVRKGSDGSMIATAYDPKLAADYVCLGAPKEWCIAGAVNKINLDDASLQLEQCVDSELLNLGPGVTPRVVCKIYNKIDNATGQGGGGGGKDEFLGECEISITSVLSNCDGQVVEEWGTMVNENNGMNVSAGDVLLSMRFRRKVDLDGEEATKARRKVDREKKFDEERVKKALKSEFKKAGLSPSGQSTPRSDAGSVSMSGGGSSVVKHALARSLSTVSELKSSLSERNEELMVVRKEKERADELRRRAEKDKEGIEARFSELQRLKAASSSSSTGSTGANANFCDNDNNSAEQREKREEQVNTRIEHARNEEKRERDKVVALLKRKEEEIDKLRAEHLKMKVEAEAPKAEAPKADNAEVEFQSQVKAEPEDKSITSKIRKKLTIINPKAPARLISRLLNAPLSAELGLNLSGGMSEALVSIFDDLDLLDSGSGEWEQFVQECFATKISTIRDLVSVLGGGGVDIKAKVKVNGNVEDVGIKNPPMITFETGTKDPREKLAVFSGIDDNKRKFRSSLKSVNLSQTLPTPPTAPERSRDRRSATKTNPAVKIKNGEYELPKGWTMKYRADGKAYYVDHVNRRTQWDRPAGVKKRGLGGTM